MDHDYTQNLDIKEPQYNWTQAQQTLEPDNTDIQKQLQQIQQKHSRLFCLANPSRLQTQKPFTSPKTNTATQIKEKRKKKI